MFEVVHPSTVFVSSGNPKQTSVLNNGISVSDVNANIAKAIAQNRAKRKHGTEHIKRLAKY